MGQQRSTPIYDVPARPSPPDALLRPLARLLRPFVRLLIRLGVTFPVLADLLRALYVEVARHDLLPGEHPRTDSRVAVLTGIHRKELRRQRLGSGGDAEPEAVTLNSRLIARWLARHADAEGQPLPLPRVGPSPSFEALVTEATRDVRPRAVLDEWAAQGIASLSEDGMVRLHAAGLLPVENLEARLFHLARNLHDHIAGAAANIAAPGCTPFLERSIHYDGLGLEAAAALESAAREAANRLLQQVNRAALGIIGTDALAGGMRPTRRVNLGIYLYAEDEPAKG